MELIEIKTSNMQTEKDTQGIKIICKHCKNEQEYTLRNPNKIPSRPKTQCSNPDCEKWIYIDRDLLVKKFGQKDMTKNDQKIDQTKPLKLDSKPKNSQKSRIQSQTNLTKSIDQRPKNNDQMTKTKIQAKSIKDNRNTQEVIFFDQMSKEIKIFGRTIPLDKVREIARKTLENSRNMIKGLKYYLNAWESRYNKYKIEKPDNFLIDEYENMEQTLRFLYEIKEINEKLKNTKKEREKK